MDYTTGREACDATNDISTGASFTDLVLDAYALRGFGTRADARADGARSSASARIPPAVLSQRGGMEIPINCLNKIDVTLHTGGNSAGDGGDAIGTSTTAHRLITAACAKALLVRPCPRAALARIAVGIHGARVAGARVVQHQALGRGRAIHGMGLAVPARPAIDVGLAVFAFVARRSASASDDPADIGAE